jgi:hypothetical protein
METLERVVLLQMEVKVALVKIMVMDRHIKEGIAVE